MPRRVNAKALGDAILHPARLQILRTFQLNGPQTISELARALPSIPQASLYRHVNALLDAGVLQERESRRGARGAPERVYYAPDSAPVTITPKGKERTQETLRRYYLALIAAQTAEFEKAIESGSIPEKNFTVRHSLVYLNDNELEELRSMFRRLEKFERNPPKGRIAFNLGLELFPAKKSR